MNTKSFNLFIGLKEIIFIVNYFNRNVKLDLKYMQIMFLDGTSGRDCVIHINNSTGVLTAQIFTELDRIDERVRPLVTAFRYWAMV